MWVKRSASLRKCSSREERDGKHPLLVKPSDLNMYVAIILTDSAASLPQTPEQLASLPLLAVSYIGYSTNSTAPPIVTSISFLDPWTGRV